MKKTFFLMLTVLAVLASCSSDEMFGVKSNAASNSIISNDSIVSDSIVCDSIATDSIGKHGRNDHGGFGHKGGGILKDSLTTIVGKYDRKGGVTGGLDIAVGKGKHGLRDSLSVVVDSLRTFKPKGHDKGHNNQGGLPKDSLRLRK